VIRLRRTRCECEGVFNFICVSSAGGGDFSEESRGEDLML
jgi:hypothetical protein